jgi:hypothetical protein
VADGLIPIPQDASDLYDSRDPKGIERYLPFNQGDVFAACAINGLDLGSDQLVMLFMHPCTMREGVRLREWQTVVPVIRESKKKVLAGSERWAKRFKVMPLPDLSDEGKSTHYGDFMRMSTVPRGRLDRDQRIAQLSELGRRVLQQRIIYHLVRYAPAREVLAECSGPVDREIELQAEWVSMGVRSLGDGPVDLVNLERLATEDGASRGHRLVMREIERRN